MERHGLTFTNPGSLEKVLGLRLRNSLAVGAGQRLGGDGVEAWFGRAGSPHLPPLAQTAALALQEVAAQFGCNALTTGSKNGSKGAALGRVGALLWGGVRNTSEGGVGVPGQPGLVLMVVAVRGPASCKYPIH